MATAEALAEMTNDASLATKYDLATLKHEIENQLGFLKADVLVLKWMMGFLLAGVFSLVIKAFFS